MYLCRSERFVVTVNSDTFEVLAVDRRKRRHILLAADAYVRLVRSDLPVRFDVISILYDGTRWQIEHYEDAFSPGLTSL